MVVSPNSQSITCLYRSLLRQVHQLPHDYLRQFFRIRVKNTVQNAIRAHKETTRAVKLKRARKELKRLHLANTGNSKAFSRVLDLAYGRMGPLRHAIMKLLLSHETATPPPKLIPSVEKSRLPIYSPELVALLASTNARRTGKPVSSAQLKNPPTLSPRADLSSDQARIFGSFSKRREVNIRWRYFTANWKTVYPPLEVHVKRGQITQPPTDLGSVGAAGIRPVGLQGAGVFEELTALGGSISSPPTPRRQRAIPSESSIAHRLSNIQSSSTLPVARTRFLRRRYRELLGRVPVLTYNLEGQEKNPSFRGTYGVSLAKAALSHKIRNAVEESTEADDADMAWVGYSARSRK